jgi:probable DNA repair protein
VDLARKLYDTTPLQPLVAEGYVLLTPNFRLARRIKSEWDAQCAARGERVWESLPVVPLESWLLQRWEEAVAGALLPPQVQLGQAQALLLWQQAIAAEERDSDRYHLLRPTAAAEIAQQARDSLLRWQVDTASGSVRQHFRLDTDCDTFLRWLDIFEHSLQTAGLVTAADCIRQLHGCAGQLPPARVALLEFEDIPPLLRAAIDALCADVRELQPQRGNARRLLHACDDKRAELRAVAQWAVRTSRDHPGETAGIVLSDMAADRTALEYLLRREFDCLGDDYGSLPVNFSTGIALDRVPVVRDALAALAMALPETTVPAVVGLLRSRFLELPDAATPLANLLLDKLFAMGRETLQVAELRYLASELALDECKGLTLGRHLLGTAGLRSLRQQALPSQWVEVFCEILSIWGWPGSTSLDSLEYQQVELWYRTLDEFCRHDVVSQPMDFAAALQLLRDSCSRQVSQPKTADSDIQVLGPLEAAGLVFDHLWLVGLQADGWPAAPRPNPFIPLALQRPLQMPHATPEREWAFAAGLVAQYSHAAAQLRASYCRELDGVPQQPSALVKDFEYAELPPLSGSPPDWSASWRQRDLEYLQEQAAPVVAGAELANMGGGSGLLEDQSQCPFRAFARRRLRVEPLGAFGVGLSAADRGSLLHDALFALWGELGDHATLLARDEEALAATVDAAVSAALDNIPGRQKRALGATYWRLEQQRLAGLLREWLEVERLRAGFVVSQREEEVSLQLGQLSIRLRVDRIDSLPDGSRLVIDYKSGLSKVQDWMGERPAKPQLLLYGIAAPGAAAALAFAQIRPRECRFVGLGSVAAAPGIQSDIEKAVRGRMDAGDWEALNERWRENLEALAQAFVAGEAAVDPLGPASCTWCGLQPLCRIGSAVVEEGAE